MAMARMTYFVVQTFQRTKRHGFEPKSTVPAQDEGHAARMASRLAEGEGIGAIAFSRTGDPAIGEYDDAVIIGVYGAIPADALETMAA